MNEFNQKQRQNIQTPLQKNERSDNPKLTLHYTTQLSNDIKNEHACVQGHSKLNRTQYFV